MPLGKFLSVDDGAPHPQDTADATREFVVAVIGDKHYALPIDSVREILQMVEPMPMPSWKRSAIGMIDVRGELIPLMDVSAALGVAGKRLSASQMIVILVSGSGPVWGLIADRIQGVSSAVIRSADHWNPHLVRTQALYRGVLQLEAGPAVVLEPEALLSALQREQE